MARFWQIRILSESALHRYLQGLSEENQHCAIDTIHLQLQDYLERFGIGLMSVSVGVNAGTQILQPEEWKAPTVGVIPNDIPKDCSRMTVAFPVEEGAEEITVLSQYLTARGYMPGEIVKEEIMPPVPWLRHDSVIIPQGTKIGVSVAVLDRSKLIASRLPFAPILRSDRAKLNKKNSQETGEVYLCRYLTQETVRAILGL